jgi:hypothetical protein
VDMSGVTFDSITRMFGGTATFLDGTVTVHGNWRS